MNLTEGMDVENKSSMIIDIIIRSIAFVVINYLLVSTELSFKASALGLIASLANIWLITDYYESVQRQTKNKGMTILLCVLCFIASVVIAYFVGYIRGTIIQF